MESGGNLAMDEREAERACVGLAEEVVRLHAPGEARHRGGCEEKRRDEVGAAARPRRGARHDEGRGDGERRQHRVHVSVHGNGVGEKPEKRERKAREHQPAPPVSRHGQHEADSARGCDRPADCVGGQHVEVAVARERNERRVSDHSPVDVDLAHRNHVAHRRVRLDRQKRGNPAQNPRTLATPAQTSRRNDACQRPDRPRSAMAAAMIGTTIKIA